MDSGEPRRPDAYIPTVSPASRPAFHHLRMCQYVFALYILFSAWFAFSDDDCIRQWREIAREVGLKQERESTTDLAGQRSVCLRTEELFETEKATREGVEERWVCWQKATAATKEKTMPVSAEKHRVCWWQTRAATKEKTKRASAENYRVCQWQARTPATGSTAQASAENCRVCW